jgi:hypothetical protein
MKHVPTLLLRAAVAFMILVALFLTGLIEWGVYRGWTLEFPDLAHLRYPVMTVIGLSAIPFLVAAFQALKLLDYVDKNKIFTEVAVLALKKIKYSAFGLGLIWAAAMPIVFLLAENDDAPGLVVFGMFFAAAPIVAAVFVGVAENLLQNAIAFKSENDLTV